jgi:hypothetical protein
MSDEKEQSVIENTLRNDRSVCGMKPCESSGGYHHWYCQRRAWHLGRHRFNNYVWWWRNPVKYAPVPMSAVTGDKGGNE